MKFFFHPFAENSNANAMQNATFPSYNFPDYGNNDLTMQNELKPSIHMDIPPGKKIQFLAAIAGRNFSLLFLKEIFFYANLSLSFIAQHNLFSQGGDERMKEREGNMKKEIFFSYPPLLSR